MGRGIPTGPLGIWPRGKSKWKREGERREALGEGNVKEGGGERGKANQLLVPTRKGRAERNQGWEEPGPRTMAPKL